MSEGPPKRPFARTEAQEQKRNEIVALKKRLERRREPFPFPGLDPQAYDAMKVADEACPGFVTPVDELTERFKNEGMKVVFGEHSEMEAVLILPFGSNDINMDSIHPRQLNTATTMDSRLLKLIALTKK